MSRTELLARIRSRCVEDGGCLVWPGACADGNCPHIRDGRRYVNIRRFVYEQTQGPVPARMVIAVTCECKRCIRHIAPMTVQQVRKMVAERGAYSQSVHGPRVSAGRRKNAKFAEDVVQMVRSSEASGAEISRRTGMSESHVSKVRRGLARRDYGNPFSGLGA